MTFWKPRLIEFWEKNNKILEKIKLGGANFVFLFIDFSTSLFLSLIERYKERKKETNKQTKKKRRKERNKQRKK